MTFLIFYSSPNEFRFVTAGSDWPSFAEMEDDNDNELPTEEPRLRNPIRRAARWISRRRNWFDTMANVVAW